MRISSSQLHAAAINTILGQQASLSNIQLQIATGRKILTPADDPAGAARALQLSQSESVTGQYEKNSDIAESRLRREESTLTSATELIQRVRVLTLQANNDTQGNETRPLIAAEIKQRFAELVSIANTRDANNEYLFSGFQSQTEAFTVNPGGIVTYNGDEGQRFLQIGTSRQVATGDSGAEVFGLVGSGNGEFINRAHAFNTGSGVINSNTIFDTAAYVEDDYDVVFGEQTAVAAGALAFNDAIGIDDALEYQLSINTIPIPFAPVLDEVATPTLADIEAAINGETANTGVRAYVDAGQLYLANTLPTATPITVSETLANASDAGDSVTGLFGSALTQGAPTNDVVYDNANGYLVLDSNDAIVTSGAYTAGSNIDFNGQRLVIGGTPSNGDQFSTSPNTKQDLFATLQSLTSALEAPSQNIPAVPTVATLTGFTAPVSAGLENFQVTIDGINLVTSPSLPVAGDTINGGQLDADLATFLGANAGYTIVSGSFATNDLVLQKDDGTDLVVAITANTTTAGAVNGLVGATTNGTVAEPNISATFHQTIARVLDNLDRNLGSVIDIRSRVGARLNSIDDQTNLNEASILQVRDTLSGIQDLDYAEAISQLEQQTTSLQAAQQSFLRIQGLSLFNFL